MLLGAGSADASGGGGGSFATTSGPSIDADVADARASSFGATYFKHANPTPPMKTAMSMMNQTPDPDLVGDAPARYAIGAMLGAGAGIDSMVGGTLPCG